MEALRLGSSASLLYERRVGRLSAGMGDAPALGSTDFTGGRDRISDLLTYIFLPIKNEHLYSLVKTAAAGFLDGRFSASGAPPYKKASRVAWIREVVTRAQFTLLTDVYSKLYYQSYEPVE